MVCSISCSISAVFIIGMMYFYYSTGFSKVMKNYKNTLSENAKNKYEEISKERRNISIQGYFLGFLLSFIIIILYYYKKIKLTQRNLVCITLATSFIVNYFYYVLYPKSDWIVNYLKTEQEIKNWRLMYKEMQFNYHFGLLLGIIAVGIFSFAFTCNN